MTFASIATAVAFCIVLCLTVKPLGGYMDAVFAGRPHLGSRLFGGVERGLYRACGIAARSEMTWQRYAFCLLAISVTSERTDTALFGGLLVANVVIVGALTFLPADALGRSSNTCCYVPAKLVAPRHPSGSSEWRLPMPLPLCYRNRRTI